MTKISTFKIFILDLRQNLELRLLVNLVPGLLVCKINTYFFSSAQEILNS